MKMKKIWIALFLITGIIVSCDNEPDFYEISYGPGVYILHEGANNNGIVSYIKRDIGGVYTDIYQNKNQEPIGGKVKSMYQYNGISYIVCENKIVAVDWAEFSYLHTIDNLMLAQFMYNSKDTAFVTEWRSLNEDSGWVRKIDLTTQAPLDTLKVGKRPAHMLRIGNRLFVSNTNDSTVTVVDIAGFTVETTIQVDYNPENLVLDNNGVIWLLCRGKLSIEPGGPTNGSLMKIDPNSLTVTNTIPFSGGNPNFLRIKADKEHIYYYHEGGIYYMDIDAPILPSSPLINVVGNTSAMDVDPETGFVYVADEKDGNSNGRLRWYNGSTGLWVDSSDISIKPSGFYFISE